MCPEDVVLSCTGDTAVFANGMPQLELTCCPIGAPEGSSECTTVSAELAWSWTDVASGSCPVTVTRTFTATLSAGDLDTVVVCTQLLQWGDTTAPEITCPPDVELSCGDPIDPANVGAAIGVDDCGTVVMTYADFPLTEGAAAVEGTLRIWTATDGCGNTAVCEQTIAVPDATPPVITLACPPDTALSFVGDCTLEAPFGMYGEASAEVTDGQDANPVVEVTFSDVALAPCAGEVIVTRTWLVTATDECGNTAEATCEQTLTFTDAEPPVFASTCGIADGDQLAVCCAADGTIALPAPCLVTVSDNCGATVEYEETAQGYAPVPGAQQACAAIQPVAFENGLTCEGDTTHALRLFCFPGSDEQVAYFTAMGAGEVQYFDETTWSLTWTVMALDNPNAGFDLTATFTDGLDWAAWNAREIPSGFKGDCAELAQAQTWMYYLLSEGTLTGWGEYTGSTFALAHQPESKFYGTQLGEGANQHNAQYGFGSTLTYTGTFVENGTEIASGIECCGDLHGELECCLPFTLTRTYTATDCAGNTAEFSYQVVSTGDPCPEVEESTAERTTEWPQGRSGGISLTGLSPNPSDDNVSLRFTVEAPMEVAAAILSLSGQVMQQLGTRASEPGAEQTLDFQVGTLPAGLYQLRLSSPEAQAMRSLLVVH